MFLRIVVIIAIGLLAYGAMLHAPFRIMDDRLSIVENPAIKSLKNIPGVFQEGYFHDQSYYRPLVNLSFMGEYQLYGFHSFFYNLDNLILHILNGLLVFLLVTRLTNNDKIGFWTGFLFVIHPIQWEAVCNVPGRSILMSGFFVLSTFVIFLEYYKHQRWYYLPMFLGTFFLGLLCKESTVVLPFVIAGYLSLDKTKTWGYKFKCLCPFLVAIAGYIFMREYFGITDVNQAGQPYLLILGFVTFLRSLITDLRLFILPVDLHYDRSIPFLLSFSQTQVWGTCLFWTAVLLLIVRWYRGIHPFFLFLMFWFSMELFPVSQLVASIGVGAGYISTAEHFLYMACIPVFIGMVMTFQWIIDLNVKKEFLKPIILKFLAGGFLVFLFLTAIEQSIYASNEFNMINRSLAYEPNNPRLQGAMAMLSVFRNDIPDAEMHFRAAVKAEPLNPVYHISLGSALCQQGKLIEGLEQFVAFDPPKKNKALVERLEKTTMVQIRQQLSHGKTFNARGWLAIGIYYAKFNQNNEAIEAFLRCVKLNPYQTDAWFNLGSIYESQQNWTSAKMAYSKVLELPDLTYFQRDFVIKHLKLIEGH